MKLLMLDAWLLRHNPDDGSHAVVHTLLEADGVQFQCPKCAKGRQQVATSAAKGYVTGVHSVICWFRGRVPDELSPGPGRWTPRGTGLVDLTLTPSVDLGTKEGSCGWHGHVTNGNAE